MIILGIDPGTATTGYGVIKKEGADLFCLSYGVIKTEKTLSPARRLEKIRKEVESIIKEFKPSILAIENVYFFKNLKTAFPVSQAKGVIMALGAKEKMEVYEFTPLQIKSAITGTGRAEKKQVQKMIQASLKLEDTPTPSDAADALGAAICASQVF